MTLFFSVGRLRELKCGLQYEETRIKDCYLRPFPVRILGHPDVGPQTGPVDWPPPQLERLSVQDTQLSLGPDNVDRAFPIVSPEKEIRVSSFRPTTIPEFPSETNLRTSASQSPRLSTTALAPVARILDR